MKEFKNLFRTPIFLFQCIIPSFIFPILIMFPLYREFQEMKGYGISFHDFGGTVNEVLNSGFGLGMVLALINFLYTFNFMSVTSISRDGENALFMKYIPIPLSRQYKYKSIPGMIINMFPLIFVLTVLKILFMELSWSLLLKIFVIGILSNIVVNYFSVAIDVLRPKLYWSSEYTVVKQNLKI